MLKRLRNFKMFNSPFLSSVLRINACFTIYIIKIDIWRSVLFFLPFSITVILCMTKFSLLMVMEVGCLLTWVLCVCNDCFLHEDYEMSYKFKCLWNKKRNAGLHMHFCVLNMSNYVMLKITFIWPLTSLLYSLANWYC